MEDKDKYEKSESWQTFKETGNPLDYSKAYEEMYSNENTQEDNETEEEVTSDL